MKHIFQLKKGTLYRKKLLRFLFYWDTPDKMNTLLLRLQGETTSNSGKLYITGQKKKKESIKKVKLFSIQECFQLAIFSYTNMHLCYPQGKPIYISSSSFYKPLSVSPLYRSIAMKY